jgi:hypothetical protein
MLLLFFCLLVLQDEMLASTFVLKTASVRCCGSAGATGATSKINFANLQLSLIAATIKHQHRRLQS